MSVRSLRYNSLMLGQAKYRSASTDRDAAAFLEAAGIYKSDQRKAIYELVRLLKQYGLWSKMKAIYPFIGGTATTHKWNLKDPQDTDAAFRLTFSGGWTHSANGITGNGSNSYANTYYIPNVDGLKDDWSRSIYSRTSTNTQTQIECGSADGVSASFRSDSIGVRQTDGNAYHGDTGQNASNLVYANADGRGYYATVRRGNADTEAYKNGASMQTGTNTSLDPPLYAFYIGARNYVGTAQFHTTRNLAFCTIGQGLTDTEAANLYSAVDKYQRLLSRNV